MAAAHRRNTHRDTRAGRLLQTAPGDRCSTNCTAKPDGAVGSARGFRRAAPGGRHYGPDTARAPGLPDARCRLGRWAAGALLLHAGRQDQLSALPARYRRGRQHGVAVSQRGDFLTASQGEPGGGTGAGDARFIFPRAPSAAHARLRTACRSATVLAPSPSTSIDWISSARAAATLPAWSSRNITSWAPSPPVSRALLKIAGFGLRRPTSLLSTTKSN